MKVQTLLDKYLCFLSIYGGIECNGHKCWPNGWQLKICKFPIFCSMLYLWNPMVCKFSPCFAIMRRSVMCLILWIITVTKHNHIYSTISLSLTLSLFSIHFQHDHTQPSSPSTLPWLKSVSKAACGASSGQIYLTLVCWYLVGWPSIGSFTSWVRRTTIHR